MTVSADWVRKPIKMTITITEYQIYDITELKQSETVKRRFLCCSSYYFYTDEDEGSIDKCLLVIKDNFGVVCFKETFNRVDFLNRKYLTDK